MGDYLISESQWTIDTLKELFESRLAALKDAHNADVDLLKARLAAADEALRLKSEADRVHFDSLNHEGQRLLAANAASVPRELYDSDKKAVEEWRRSMEQRLATTLTEATFNTYKESTQRATNIQSGQRQGIGLTTTTIVSALSAGAFIIAIILGIAKVFGH